MNPRLKDPLSEQVFEATTNRSGNLLVEFRSEPLSLPLSAQPAFWVLALELPEFPKIEKAFFVYDPRASRVMEWNKSKASEVLEIEFMI